MHMHVFWDQEVLLVIIFFPVINGEILICLLIQTDTNLNFDTDLNHSKFKSGQLPSFHSGCIYIQLSGKEITISRLSLHFLHSPPISQLPIFHFHYMRSFFATCVSSIAIDPYAVFKTSILTSSLISKCLAL